MIFLKDFSRRGLQFRDYMVNSRSKFYLILSINIYERSDVNSNIYILT